MSSEESEDEELRELIRQRERQMLGRTAQEQLQKRAEEEARKKALSRLVFSPEARQRLANVRLVKPELANQLEDYLISLAQQGKISTPIDDDTLKKILQKIQDQKRETKVWRLGT